jgi:hypothetical protein
MQLGFAAPAKIGLNMMTRPVGGGRSVASDRNAEAVAGTRLDNAFAGRRLAALRQPHGGGVVKAADPKTGAAHGR